MPSTFLQSSSLIDRAGHVISLAIVAVLLSGVAANLKIRSSYQAMERALRAAPAGDAAFAHPLLDRILREAREAASRSASVQHQVLIENLFQRDLRGLLLAERFVKASTGILIVLGLVGTFYGLTASIGKLVNLVTADGSSDLADLGQSLTHGLSEALSGMAVAFTTSLLGISAAIVMILLNVVSNPGDQRTGLMIQLESSLEHLTAGGHREEPSGYAAVSQFAASVAHLEGVVARFDGALQSFSTTTREFREFNLHLKDNIQRMSLSFADFSEGIQVKLDELKKANR